MSGEEAQCAVCIPVHLKCVKSNSALTDSLNVAEIMFYFSLTYKCQCFVV